MVYRGKKFILRYINPLVHSGFAIGPFFSHVYFLHIFLSNLLISYFFIAFGITELLKGF